MATETDSMAYQRHKGGTALRVRPVRDQRRMQTCETCGGSIGTMGDRYFHNYYIRDGHPCPLCCGPVRVEQEVRVPEVWISAETVGHRFDIDPQRIRDAGNERLLKRRRHGNGWQYLEGDIRASVATRWLWLTRGHSGRVPSAGA